MLQFRTPTPRSAYVVGLTTLFLAACGGAPQAASSPDLQANASASPASRAGATPVATPLPDGVLAAIPLDANQAPTAVAAGFGAVWVASHRGTLLYRIDPDSNTVVARIDVGQEACGPLLVGLGKVWVGHCVDGEKVIAVDPTTNQVVGSFIGGPGRIAFGALWVSTNSFDALERIDPITYKVTGRVNVPAGMVADGDGSLWALDLNLETGQYGGLISRIDPNTLKVIGTLTAPVSGTYPWMAFAFGALWLKPVDNGTLLKIDPSTGRTTIFELPAFEPFTEFGDVYIASDATSLWLRTSAKAISQIDPQSGRVLKVYPADPYSGGGYVTVSFGSLWVVNFEVNSVWRDRITG
jgi:streptogramin lyase